MFYDTVDPWVYTWLYYSFIQAEEDKYKFARSLAIFQGSFANPEMAKSIHKQDNPTAEMDDEQFEAVSEYILAEDKKEANNTRKRKRKLLLKQQETKR